MSDVRKGAKVSKIREATGGYFKGLVLASINSERVNRILYFNEAKYRLKAAVFGVNGESKDFKAKLDGDRRDEAFWLTTRELEIFEVLER